MAKRRSRAIAAGLSLGLALLAVSSAAAAPTRVQETRDTNRSSRGVRTYGPGAVRIDLRTSSAVERSTLGEPVEPAVTATRKISGVPMVGYVRAFAISPDGTFAVYIADQEVLARTELYSVRVDGTAAPVKISATVPFGAGDQGVSAFQISSDSARVVFRADASAGGGSDDLYSVPIDGSSGALQLNTAAQRPVSAFGLSPNGAWALFLGPDTAFGGGGSELYAASITTAASAKQISDARRTIAAGAVVFADFSPDSVRAIYSADAVTDGVYQWFSVPIAAVAPGSDEVVVPPPLPVEAVVLPPIPLDITEASAERAQPEFPPFLAELEGWLASILADRARA